MIVAAGLQYILMVRRIATFPGFAVGTFLGAGGRVRVGGVTVDSPFWDIVFPMQRKFKYLAPSSLRALFVGLALGIGLGLFAGTGDASAAAIGSAKQIVNKVFGKTLTRTIRAGEEMNANQRIRTGRDSAADILFLDDTTLFIGELTNLVLDEMVYDAGASKVSGSLELLKGVLRFASARSVKVGLNIKTAHGGFGVRGTAFDLLTSAAATEITVHEGQVAIQTPFGNANVGSGEVYQLTAAAAPVELAESSPGMQRSVAKMLGLLDAASDEPMRTKVAAAERVKRRSKAQDKAKTEQGPKPETVAVLAQDQGALKKAIQGKNPANLIYLDTTAGLLVIETLPKLAPAHVRRIKNLVRAKFYDGLIFHNVVANFAAETGDPAGSGLGGSGQKLKAEFSDTRFVRGVVGMKRSRGDKDSADSQFFITSVRPRIWTVNIRSGAESSTVSAIPIICKKARRPTIRTASPPCASAPT